VLKATGKTIHLLLAMVVSSVFSKSAGVRGLSNELMQLRKICQHPFLFESVEDKMNPGGMIDNMLVRTSGKIELLHRILPKFFATDHRVR
jgi:ATP-dependent helicase STH1/SNF2